MWAGLCLVRANTEAFPSPEYLGLVSYAVSHILNTGDQTSSYKDDFSFEGSDVLLWIEIHELLQTRPLKPKPKPRSGSACSQSRLISSLKLRLRRRQALADACGGGKRRHHRSSPSREISLKCANRCPAQKHTPHKSTPIYTKIPDF
jgi:hypothetical protein